ncbi:conserved protein of unknown function [Methylorubrum extorquens DM4]|uniref:Uncharacterized protein n=1 Tax=Methylorubrum extorquens (strain DSM 6343 / CIP 106787 / DM4) TaxID=661410 RepID=C7CMJ7_METED|nr:conserved protein of unknown function [Methylorubrum extorquens DM4]
MAVPPQNRTALAHCGHRAGELRRESCAPVARRVLYLLRPVTTCGLAATPIKPSPANADETPPHPSRR